MSGDGTINSRFFSQTKTGTLNLNTDTYLPTSTAPIAPLSKVWGYGCKRGSPGLAGGVRVHSIVATAGQVGGGEPRGGIVAHRPHANRRLQDHFAG